MHPDLEFAGGITEAAPPVTCSRIFGLTQEQFALMGRNVVVTYISDDACRLGVTGIVAMHPNTEELIVSGEHTNIIPIESVVAIAPIGGFHRYGTKGQVRRTDDLAAQA